MGVDRDEAVGVGGDAGWSAAAQAREREDAVDLQTPPRRPHQDRARRPVVELRVGSELDRDSGVVELRRHDLDRARAEDRQRGVLGGDERDLGVHAHSARVGGDEERQLVGRQGPPGAGRDDDRQALAVAIFQVAQKPADRFGIARVVPREGVPGGIRRLGGGARREHERVIHELPAVAELDRPGGGVDGDQGRLDERSARGARGMHERGPAPAAERERLGDRERSVDEVGGGGDERQLHSVARHRVEREQSFQSGDAAAGDNNAMRVACHEVTEVVGQVRYRYEARRSSAT